MTLWELQNQWDSEADKRKIRQLRAIVRHGAKPINIAKTIAVNIAIFVIIVGFYLATPGFERGVF